MKNPNPSLFKQYQSHYASRTQSLFQIRKRLIKICQELKISTQPVEHIIWQVSEANRADYRAYKLQREIKFIHQLPLDFPKSPLDTQQKP